MAKRKYDLSLNVTVIAEDDAAMRKEAKRLYALLAAESNVEGDYRDGNYLWVFRHPSWDSVMPYAARRKLSNSGYGPPSARERKWREARSAARKAKAA